MLRFGSLKPVTKLTGNVQTVAKTLLVHRPFDLPKKPFTPQFHNKQGKVYPFSISGQEFNKTMEKTLENARKNDMGYY